MADYYKINKRPKDDTSDDDVKMETSVTEKTKIAISSGYLLSSIIADYFDQHKCEYMTNNEHKQLVESILANLFVAGGACRALLLAKPINDLDIYANTRYNAIVSGTGTTTDYTFIDN